MIEKQKNNLMSFQSVRGLFIETVHFSANQMASSFVREKLQVNLSLPVSCFKRDNSVIAADLLDRRPSQL